MGSLGALAACSAGGGGGGTNLPPNPGIGEDGGDSAPPVSDGTHVATLQTRTPGLSSFLLRGTFPVPPGTFPRPDGMDPFAILDYDGTPVWTQTEIVSRYPNDADGADVVEVIGRVRQDPAAAPGAYLTFPVKQSPVAALPDPGTADLADFAATRSLLPLVVGLLTDTQGIELATYDVFGNRYSCRLLDGTGNLELMRYGRAMTEIKIHQIMTPDNPVSGGSGTLPHMFSVHGYLRTFTGQEVLGLDLRFSNAHSGNDLSTNLDNPLDKVYFREIELAVPDTFQVQFDVRDPFVGTDTTSGGRRTVELVKPQSGGKMHVMRWQGQFHRRLVLNTSAANFLGYSYVTGQGRGFCVRGTDPSDGHELWSWWNRGTARYGPQNYQLPSLEHVNIGSINGYWSGEHDWIKGHLEAGSTTGFNYPIAERVKGWMHPWGVGYGGMTGGAEIYLYDGISVLAAGSIQGYRYYEMLHRMHTCRQPTALYDLDGSPSGVEDWLVDLPGGDFNDYVPMTHYGTPYLGSSFPDPFGFNQAPQFQINYVASNNLKPDYEQVHLSYDPHDFQHFIRYTRGAKVLAWVGNDSLAQDDLLMQAECFGLSYHPYKNSEFGSVQSSGMRGAMNYVSSHPASGFPFGRGESWGSDAMVASYALGTPQWRAAKLSWMQDLAQLLNDGQNPCSGFTQAVISQKFVNGLYRGRQQIEQSITENLLMGLRETVFRGVDPVRSDMLRDVLVKSLYAFISPMAWFPGETAPWTYTGVGPLDLNLPAWCSASQMPGNAYTPETDAFQDWSSFAYGYELTGDTTFLDFALLQRNGGTGVLLNLLQSELANNFANANLENKAALVALVQRLNGVL